MAIQYELEVFKKELPNLLADPQAAGKFALIRGDAVDSLWPTIDAALAAGYDRFGLEPFLVKHVVEHEEPAFFTRRVKPCR